MSKERKLKITRQKQGLTQEQVAEQAKISTRRYQDYEAGKYSKSICTAKLIAKALNSTVEELF